MAADKLQVYKCNVCGIIAEVLDSGAGNMFCCGAPMSLQVAKTEDAGKEKHAPVCEPDGDGVKIKVGSVAHPMEEKHYIQWIEVISGGKAYRQFLSPGQAPEAVFDLACCDVEIVREYCTLHGLWKA